MPVAQSIDWPRLLDELAWLLGERDFAFPDVRVPLSASRLAQALQVPRTTLIGWRDGSEPKHSDGELLLVRWCLLTGKAREFAPLERRSLSASAR